MAPAHSRPLSLLPAALEVAQDLVDDVVVEVQRPLAGVVVSGVVTSTLLTLMVLPVLYERFGGGTETPARVGGIGGSP